MKVANSLKHLNLEREIASSLEDVVVFTLLIRKTLVLKQDKVNKLYFFSFEAR